MIQVTVSTLKGESETFEVHSESPLDSLQDAIHERLGYPAEHQILVLGRVPLAADSSATLETAGIKDGSRVTMLSKVKTFSGHPEDALDEYDRLMREFGEMLIQAKRTPDCAVDAGKKLEPVIKKVFQHYDNNGKGNLNSQEAEQFLLDFATEQASFVVFMCKCMMVAESKDSDQVPMAKVEEAANKQLEDYKANRSDRNVDVIKVMTSSGFDACDLCDVSSVPDTLSLEDVLSTMLSSISDDQEKYQFVLKAIGLDVEKPHGLR